MNLTLEASPSKLIPVLPQQAIKGWPKHDNGGRAVYTSLADAMTTRYATDAHFAAYSAPALERRLTLDALRDPRRHAALGDGVPMVVAVFDVDCEQAHKASGDAGGAPAPDEWWVDELAKLDALRARHPDAFIYRTRGGYRIVYELAEPIVLRESIDSLKWSTLYTQWVAYLRRAFGIFADPACADWPRLFRLPHATRTEGGTPEERKTIGDPSRLGSWTCEISAEDVTAAEGLRSKASTPRQPKNETVATSIAAREGVLFHAIQARGELGSELEPGKWAVACPQESLHTKGERFDGSTILYAPGAGDVYGWVHCSHAHCTGRDTRAALAHFSEEEIARAKEAAGFAGIASSITAIAPRTDVLVHAEEQTVNDEVAAALRNVAGLFQRAGSLVDVVCEPGKMAGAPRIREIPLPRLRELIARAVRFYVLKEEKDGTHTEVEKHPPDWCVRAIHSRGQWDGVPPLKGVTEVPVLRPDGSIFQEPGFDPMTELLFLPNAEYERVPESPSQLDAAKACREVCAVLADFPFAGESHRSAAVSLLMSVVARPAYEGPSPLKAIDATTPGVGKSLLAEVLALTLFGRPVAKMPHTVDEEETRKAITAIAADGSPLVILDNVVHPLGSGVLDNALTSTVWKDRLLSRNQLATLPLRVEWIATGNNIAYQGDTFRRVLPIRLESPLENPEAREGFMHEDLRAFVLKERPGLVVALLTILRGYFVAGCPDMEVRRWGSFEGWSRLVPHALVWAGLADPTATRAGLESVADLRKGALEALLEGWTKLSNGKSLTAAAALDQIYPAYGNGPPGPVPAYITDLRSAVESMIPSPNGKPDARRLGKLLQSYRGRVCGGRMFEGKPYAGTMRWCVAHVSHGSHGSHGSVSNPSREEIQRDTPCAA